MFQRLKLRLLVLAGSCLLFPVSAYADPITISLDESVTNFTFKLTGTAVDHDFKYGQILGTFWSINFEIEEDDGPRDELSVLRFSFQHVQGLPGESVGPLLSFQPTTFLAVISGNNLGVFTVSAVHFGDQFDRAVGLLRFQVTDNQITGYSFEVNGQHAIPEPATLILLTTGLVGVAIRRRRNKTPSLIE
jgi:hypothetical protein